MTVDGQETDAAGNPQETALYLVRNFQSDEMKGFINSELSLPSSMHSGLGRLRKTLSGRSTQFLDLKDFVSQVDYLGSIIGEIACPRNWVAFCASVSCLFSATGTFPEGTKDVFSTDAILGSMCGLRARYLLIALRDLWALRVLKAQPMQLQAGWKGKGRIA